AAAARATVAAALAGRPPRAAAGGHRRRPGVHAAGPAQRTGHAPRASRLLRRRSARRHPPLDAALPGGPAAHAATGAAEGDVVAVGLARARRHGGTEPVAGAGAALGLRVRPGARALSSRPRRPFARVLARGREPLPGLARRARLVPRPRSQDQGGTARVAGLMAACRPRLRL